MAFEYMMGYWLLDGQHDRVAENINLLDNFDYPKGHIPRHYAEAILLYRAIEGKKVNLAGREIDAGTIERFRDFLRLRQNYKHDQRSGAIALFSGFRDTYYYYYIYIRPQFKFE